MKINNLEWKIKYNENLNENLFGQTNYENLTIYLRPQCCKDNVKRTLLHEIVHAYCYSYGLHFIESYDRENLCEFIAHNFENISKIYSDAQKEILKDD